MSSRFVIAFALLLACTGREREPAAAKPTIDPQPEGAAEPEPPPLVTIELGLIGDQAREQLIARHGPDSPLARADGLLLVHHRIAEPWHIYWQNPGDSGLRTRLSFDLTGVEVGSVVYPGPDRFVADGGQVSFGWERDAVLFVPLANEIEGAKVQVRSDWLACHESCIPGHSEASARVDQLIRRDDAVVRAMVDRLPEPAGDRLRTRWTDSRLHVEPGAADLRLLAFFPHASDKAVLQATTLGEAALEIDYRFDGPPPAELGQGVVTLGSAGEIRWLELAAPWPSP